MPTFIRLTDFKDRDSKEAGFFDLHNRHTANQDNFAKIPGNLTGDDKRNNKI